MREDSLLLIDILGNIDAILEESRSRSEDRLLQERTIRDSILYKLAVIGEAVNKLSPELKARYLKVPWRTITGLRNTLIHEYFGVNDERVWIIVEDELPELRNTIIKMISELKGDNNA
jgi:uncharacterized protein with HEPN domain